MFQYLCVRYLAHGWVSDMICRFYLCHCLLLVRLPALRIFLRWPRKYTDRTVNQTNNMLKRLNDALPGLVLGILVYGVLVELIGVWFVSDKLRFSTGLAIGIALACGMAINIAVVLRDAVDIYGESQARAKIIAKSILRYVVVVIVFFVMMKCNIGNLFSAFIGVLGLKVSAYSQPFAHKLITKLQGRGDVSSNSEDSEAI